MTYKVCTIDHGYGPDPTALCAWIKGTGCLPLVRHYGTGEVTAPHGAKRFQVLHVERRKTEYYAHLTIYQAVPNAN